MLQGARPAATAAMQPGAGECISHGLEGRVAVDCVRAEHGQVLLSEPCQQSGNETDAHTAAEIAHERGHAAYFVVLFLRNARITERIDGNEQKRQSQSNDHTPTDRHAETDIEIEAGHTIEARSEEHTS